jgi:mono/diheme cytochrome c family protein
MQPVERRWLLVSAAIIAMIVAVGCGRVDLETLTPEAVRTEVAATATARASIPTPDPNSASPGAEIPKGDVAAGDAIYNSECAGCHEGTRAKSLKGQVIDAAKYVPMLRSGEGFGAPHPVYALTDIRPLNDNDFNNIFAYLAAQ